MVARYQHGYLRCKQRKKGTSSWEYMWREQDASGKRVRRTMVIGTVEEYPTEQLARAAVNGLRMQNNEERNRQRYPAITVSELIDHYLVTELSKDAIRHSHAIRIIYREFLLDGSNHPGARWIYERSAR